MDGGGWGTPRPRPRPAPALRSRPRMPPELPFFLSAASASRSFAFLLRRRACCVTELILPCPWSCPPPLSASATLRTGPCNDGRRKAWELGWRVAAKRADRVRKAGVLARKQCRPLSDAWVTPRFWVGRGCWSSTWWRSRLPQRPPSFLLVCEKTETRTRPWTNTDPHRMP